MTQTSDLGSFCPRATRAKRAVAAPRTDCPSKQNQSALLRAQTPETAVPKPFFLYKSGRYGYSASENEEVDAATQPAGLFYGMTHHGMKRTGVSDRGFCELVAAHLLVDRRKWLRE